MCRPSTDCGDCIPNILPFINTETLLNFNYRITINKNKKKKFFKFIIFLDLPWCSGHCVGELPLLKFQDYTTGYTLPTLHLHLKEKKLYV